MAKAYHPSYTKVNPAKDAWMYTSETVYWRKVTMLYDWLPSDRVVESWFRRVPWRLERDEKSDSWIVKYFEFRAGIGPLPQLGYVGDLWISWNARDPSVWFKVDEMDWERWKGCASSLREVSLASCSFMSCTPYLILSPVYVCERGPRPRSPMPLPFSNRTANGRQTPVPGRGVPMVLSQGFLFYG